MRRILTLFVALLSYAPLALAQISSTTQTNTLPPATAPADAETNTTKVSRLGTYTFVFNGATWDRWTGGVSISNSNFQVAQGNNGDNGAPWFMNLRDILGTEIASATTTPGGSDLGLVVRNIPSGTQAVSGTVTATVSGTVAATQSGTWSTRAQDGAGNAIASATTDPGALDRGLVVRNIPSGYQYVLGPSLDAIASGTTSVIGEVLTGYGPVALALANAVAPTATEATAQPLSVDLIGRLRVAAAQYGSWDVAATQSGTWNVTNVSGTVSLPTGASTSANQTTEITALQLIDNLPNTLGSTTSGQSGALALGAVTTAAPSYTTAQTNALSLTTAGALRTDGSAVTQPVSLAANQSVNVTQFAGTGAVTGSGTATGALRVELPTNGTGIVGLAAGSNAIGKLAANSGVDIGDVDITSQIPGTGATNLGKAEDAGAASGDTGVFALAVRKDTNATLTSADGDYVQLSADNYGVQSVSGRHPNAVRCTITSTSTSSAVVTGCAAPGSGLSIYITGLTWSSSIISTTANFMRIQSGTGGTCGTGTTVLFDGYAATAFGGQSVTFPTPIKVTANNEVCFVHASAGTRLVNIVGFIAP